MDLRFKNGLSISHHIYCPHLSKPHLSGNMFGNQFTFLIQSDSPIQKFSYTDSQLWNRNVQISETVYQYAKYLTSEPFLLPGRLITRQLPRMPHTSLLIHNTFIS